MRKNFKIKVVLSISLVLACLSSCFSAGAEQSAEKSNKEKASSKAEDANFIQLTREYKKSFFASQPSLATYYGIHKYDGKMADYSPVSQTNKLAQLRSYLKRFQSIEFKNLSRTNQFDWNLVVANIKGRVLDIESIKEWRRNPDFYSSYTNDALFTLIQRSFAPVEERLVKVIEREKQIPDFLDQAKGNLNSELVPKIFAEIAIEKMPGIIGFFEKDLVEHFKNVDDKELLNEFQTSNRRCIKSLKSYKAHIEKKLLPKANAEFAIGEKNYQAKLLCDEMVQEPVDKLLARGEHELKRLQSEFKEWAAKIDPKTDAQKVYTKIASKHPKPENLISSVSGVLEEIRKFCVEKPIVTIPGEERAKVDESPPFLRALTFASMDTPGPFEKNAKEAFYFVTLPDKNWDPKKIEEHMRSFSNQDLLNTSIHEAYPGHYVQFLWVNKAPTDVRKMFGCSSNAEGWAHYCEEMMIDQGFKNGSAELKMAQIHDALLRVCRYIAGIKMHTQGMTLTEAIELFKTEGYQEQANAEREAKRGTMDPTYLVYTMGKLDILSLRDEYRAKKQEKFDLRQFHDQFLKQGYPPLALVRAEMLQEPIKKFF